MMNQQKAVQVLSQWIDILNEIDRISIDFNASPEKLNESVDRRQQAIDEIQQLDASLLSVKEFRFGNSPELDASKLDALMEAGKALNQKIRQQDAKIIEIAKEKRSEILTNLKKNTLFKGYLASNHTLKIRPPAIVDGNA